MRVRNTYFVRDNYFYVGYRPSRFERLVDSWWTKEPPISNSIALGSNSVVTGTQSFAISAGSVMASQTINLNELRERRFTP